MSLDCNDIEELMASVYAIIKIRQKIQECFDVIDEWLSADDEAMVVSGESEIPSLRKLIRDIDERESQAAQEVVDEGWQRFLRIEKRLADKIADVTGYTFGNPVMLPEGAIPTLERDVDTGVITIGIPVGPKGDKGEQGRDGQAPHIDSIVCGGAREDWLSFINAGSATSFATA